MPDLPSFTELASEPEPAVDVLALALAAEFRSVDAPASFATLDALGADLLLAVGDSDGGPRETAMACSRVLGSEHGFAGDRERYDNPVNSMLDVVLERRRGLPIVLSVIYIAVARRAGIPLVGVGLPGHFVVGHFGAEPPVLLDPFNGGARIDAPAARSSVRPWSAHEIAWRMLNNLVGGYERRGDLAPAIRAAQMRLRLPLPGAPREAMATELRALEARLN